MKKLFDITCDERLFTFSTDGELRFEDNEVTVTGKIHIQEHVDGELKEIHVNRTTWPGYRLNERDAFEESVCGYFNDSMAYQLSDVCGDLKDLKQRFMRQILDVDGQPVNERFASSTYVGSWHSLFLCTDKFAYYINDSGDCVMTFTQTGNIISDNSFATDGLMASVDNCRTGKETLLWASELFSFEDFPEEETDKTA